MTFICVLRLVSSWFPARRIPFVTQLTGTLGQLGAVGAAVPMTWALLHLGWTRPTWWRRPSASSSGGGAAAPARHPRPPAPARGPDVVAAVRASLAASWAHPGTHLGFWMHFSTQFSATVMSLLWGFPFFVAGEGRSAATAGALLTLMVVAIMVAGPVLGWLVGNHPWHRSTMVLVIVSAIVTMWTVVLAWPGNAPLPVLALLTLVVGVGGPASMIGFDVARTSNPSHRLASASGIINQGGFSASLILVVVIGLVLDWRTPGDSTSYTPEAFRWAMSAQYVLWAVGLAQIWRWRLRTRGVVSRDELMAAIDR